VNANNVDAQLIFFAGTPLPDVPADLQPVLAGTAVRHIPFADDLLGLYRHAAAQQDPVEGVNILIDVADHAADMGMHEIAAVLTALSRGLLERAPTGPQRSSAAAALDNATAVLALQRGLVADADRFLDAGEAHAREAQDEHLAAALLLNRANAALHRGQSTFAREVAERALALAERIGDDVTATKLRLTLANLHLDAGDFTVAETLLTEHGQRIRKLRIPAFTAHLLALEGQVASERGDFETASARFDMALRTARRSGEPRRVAVAQQDLAAVAQRAGRPHLARRRYVAALQTAEEARDTPRLVALHDSLARVLHQLGRFDEAVVHARTAAELGRQTGLPGGARRLALLAAATVSAGDADTARTLLWDAIPELDADDLQMALSNAIVAARSTREDVAEVEHAVRQHLVRLSASSRGQVLEDLATLHLAAANAEQAVELLREVVELTDAEQRPWRSAMVAAELQAGAQPAAAEPFFRRAIDLAAGQGQAQVAALVRGDLGVLLGDLGRHEESLSEFRATSQEALKLGDRELLQRMRHNESETLRRLGRHQEAVTVARSALELASSLGDEDVLAGAHVALALAMASAGQDVAAAQEADAAVNVGEPSVAVRAAVAGIQAGVRCRAGDTAGALGLYRQAARLDELPLHRAESLLGVCICYAALGNRRAHDRNLQALISLIQQHHLEPRISPDLAFVARAWLGRGEHRLTGDVLGVALTLAVAGAAHSSPGGEAPDFVGRLVEAVAETFTFVAVLLVEDVPSHVRADVEAAMWNVVREQVSAGDVALHMRDWLDSALEAVTGADADPASDPLGDTGPF
jgi:tetratricopeptide (TPR) repeat protein